MNDRRKVRWKDWLVLGRLIPVITVVLAVGVSISPLFGFAINTEQLQSIVVVLLGLLAVNALTERLTMLERIESRLPLLNEYTQLRERAQLKPLAESAPNCRELWMISVSASAVFPSKFAYFDKLAKGGATVRVVLVNPDGPGLRAWEQWVTVSDTQEEIRTSLKYLQQLKVVDVKLSDTVLPFSMMMFDPNAQQGWAIVEYHGFKVTTHRPHVLLRNDARDEWFENYKRQFIELWEVAKPFSK